jgi:hypothetical protein
MFIEINSEHHLLLFQILLQRTFILYHMFHYILTFLYADKIRSIEFEVCHIHGHFNFLFSTTCAKCITQAFRHKEAPG